MRRASTLLGFIGVELGILSQVQVAEYRDVPYYKFILPVILLFLMASFVCLVWSLRNKPFHYPSLAKLEWLAKNSDKGASEVIFDFIQNVEDPSQNLDSSLSGENLEISKWSGRGLALALVAQFLLGLLIVLNWI